MMPTLGIYGIQDHGERPYPWWTHDHSLALFVDGRVEWVLELERYTRRKHDNRLHIYLEDLVAKKIIHLPSEFRIIAVDSFAGMTVLSKDGNWRVEGNYLDLTTAMPLRPARAWVNLREVEAYHCFHELAHIAANLPFTGSFKDNSLLVHIDGGASQSNMSAFLHRDGKISHLYHSWDSVWAVLNFGYNDLTHAILGLSPSQRMAAPGRLMGYAAYGEDIPEIRAWLIRNDWFKRHWEHPHKFFESARKEFGWNATEFDLRDQFLMNIAASCQAVFKEVFLSLLTRLKEQSNADYLYAAGGAMLNVELNREIIESGLFKEVNIPPCCSDTGLALGAAALAEYLDKGELPIHSPFLNRVDIDGTNGHWGRPIDYVEVGERLASGQVVAFFAGDAEIGPRALGHRSLLTTPASLRARDYVSQHVKKREWYRPVAPIILEELAEEYFPGSTKTSLTNFMLTNVLIEPRRRAEIPGVVHIDGTARVQVIRKDALQQEHLKMLLKEVWHRYNLPCLINTSFNGPGEPIVHTVSDAQKAACALGIDVLVLSERMETYSPKELKRV